MHVVRNNQLEDVDDDDQDVDFELSDASRLFGSHTNQIPLQSAVQAQRLFYGGRFVNQALSVKDGEAPLVQNLDSLDKQGRSFDEIAGENLGAVRTKKAGRVIDVSKDRMQVEYDDGEKADLDLYDHFSFNQKSGLTSNPLLKAGDVFAAGQVAASSNFTDNNGVQNMGLNARIGLVPWKGFSMDDAVPISESFAKRMAAIQYKVVKQETSDNLKTDLNHYRSQFPTRFTKEMLSKFEPNGLIKKGTILEPGDPMILGTTPRTISSVGASVGKLSKAMSQSRRDASTTWDGHQTAEVMDTRQTKNGLKVVLRYLKPTSEGDKLTIRAGAKCYHPDTELFTERGWVNITTLSPTDTVASLHDVGPGGYIDGEFGKRARVDQHLIARFEKPMAYVSYNFDGELYGLDAAHAAYEVTGNHRVWRKGFSKACRRWSCGDAADIHGTAQAFMCRAEFDLSSRTDPEFFELPPAFNGCSGVEMNCITKFPFLVWVKFMAYYLAEGNVRHSVKKDHRIIITQKERAYCRVMEKCFSDMGMKWTKSEMPDSPLNGQYAVGPNKALRLYLDQFGKAPQKFVPEIIKSSSVEAIEIFLKAYWQGDGDKDKQSEFYTTSDQMARDLQELLILSGRASTLSTRAARIRRLNMGLPLHTIGVLSCECVSTQKNYMKAFYRKAFKGKVYCVQVPGLGVVLTRMRGKVMWNGNSTVSRIIPDDQMPHTEDGQPLDMMLNPLSLVSRANPSTQHEIRLGKVAKSMGAALKIPSFLPKGQNWNDFIDNLENEHGVTSAEKIFDPVANRFLVNPVTVGYAFVNKLHHVSAGKLSTRGNGSYDNSEQPARGGSEHAQAKRFSGLENLATLSSGAYALMRENSTLRGQKNNQYWQDLRSGKPTPKVGVPFIWNKFRALLSGAGMSTREVGKGRFRLAPFTDADLDKENPVDVESGDLVNMSNMDTIKGGLFDPRIVAGDKWGRIRLPRPIINPAMEDSVRTILGLTKTQLDDVLAGRAELPPQLKNRLAEVGSQD